VFTGFYFRSDVIGWWRGESKYRGHSTNAWHAELQRWHRIVACGGSGGKSFLVWSRQPAPSEAWFAALAPRLDDTDGPFGPPLLNGDRDATGVLAELLRAPESHVRLLAIEGLEQIGLGASQTVPALLAVLEDEDEDVRQRAMQALRAIKPEVLWSAD
jgi:hypothetical protein